MLFLPPPASARTLEEQPRVQALAQRRRPHAVEIVLIVRCRKRIQIADRRGGSASSDLVCRPGMPRIFGPDVALGQLAQQRRERPRRPRRYRRCRSTRRSASNWRPIPPSQLASLNTTRGGSTQDLITFATARQAQVWSNVVVNPTMRGLISQILAAHASTNEWRKRRASRMLAIRSGGA